MATQLGLRESQQQRISRAQKTVPCICHLTTPDTIDFRGAAGGQLFVPAGASSGTITVKVSDTETGTFVPLNDSDGAVTFNVVASNAYDLPEALFASAYVQFVAESGKNFTGSLVLKG